MKVTSFVLNRRTTLKGVETAMDTTVATVAVEGKKYTVHTELLKHYSGSPQRVERDRQRRHPHSRYRYV
jgi:hypothetical protein